MRVRSSQLYEPAASIWFGSTPHIRSLAYWRTCGAAAKMCLATSLKTTIEWANANNQTRTGGECRTSCRRRPTSRVHGIFRKRVMSETESGYPYHEGMRQLQDRFQTRLLADRLDEKLGRIVFTNEDREFIASRHFFILATADASGRPDCSYKGGAPGFARVCGDNELVFPSYDGNGMFRSLGNVSINPAVGLLFIDFERPSRLRVNGRARIVKNEEEAEGFDGVQFIVRVRADRIFPNCPRYVHRMQTSEASPYVPRAGYTPPVPKWKRSEVFRDVLAPDDPARRDDTG